MTDPIPLTTDQMLERAARALGKVDLWGRRGLTMVTADEVEACVCLLAALGLVPVAPGQPVPEVLFIPVEGGFQ